MLPTISPELTPEQIDQLEQARKSLPSLKAAIRQAKQAGIDMSSQEQEVKDLEASLDKLYRVYVRKLIPPSAA